MSESITRYSGLKTRANEIKDFGTRYRDDDNIQRARQNLNGCANWLLFKDYYTISETRLTNASTCKQHLLCPFCASRRAAKLVQKNLPKVESILIDRPELIPVMITFTVKNRDDLADAFSHLVSGFRKIQKRRRDKIKTGWGETEFSKVDGAFFSYEFTHSEDKGYHPHIHVAALLTDYIDQKKLSQEWLDITGDSFVVDIRKIRFRREKQGENDNEVFDALSEVFKYALKFQDLENDQVWHAWKTLRGKRLIGSFGSLWGLKLPDELLDEDLSYLPFIEKFYKFNRFSSAYDLQSVAAITEFGEVTNTAIYSKAEDLPKAFTFNSYCAVDGAIDRTPNEACELAIDVSEARAAPCEPCG